MVVELAEDMMGRTYHGKFRGLLFAIGDEICKGLGALSVDIELVCARRTNKGV